MKGKQLGGSHGQMLGLSQQTVVGGRRMSKPYVPYGMKRYSIVVRTATLSTGYTQGVWVTVYN